MLLKICYQIWACDYTLHKLSLSTYLIIINVQRSNMYMTDQLCMNTSLSVDTI